MADWSQYAEAPAAPASSGASKWSQYVETTAPSDQVSPDAPDVAGTPPANKRYGAGSSAYVGGANGLTAGLSKYPVAAAAYVADRLRSGALPWSQDQIMNSDGTSTGRDRYISWPQALGLTKDEMDQAKEDHPAAYLGGQLVGGAVGAGKLTGGIKAATGLGSLGSLTAAGALQGGAQGYSQNENLADAGVGAGVGAAFGAGSAAIGNTLKSLSGTQLTQYVAKTLGVDKVAPEAAKAVKGVFSAASDSELGVMMKNLQELSPNLATRLWESMKAVPGESIQGAAVGTAGALLTGQDPLKGAAYGAIAGPIVYKSRTAPQEIGRAFKDLAQRNPAAVTAITQAAAGGATAATAPIAAETGSRLRALGDKWRSENQGGATGSW